jgi:hypothetical protein
LPLVYKPEEPIPQARNTSTDSTMSNLSDLLLPCVLPPKHVPSPHSTPPKVVHITPTEILTPPEVSRWSDDEDEDEARSPGVRFIGVVERVRKFVRRDTLDEAEFPWDEGQSEPRGRGRAVSEGEGRGLWKHVTGRKGKEVVKLRRSG